MEKAWSMEIWKGARDASFFWANGFVGTGNKDNRKPVKRITELTRTSKGTKCIMQLVLPLLKDGTAGDNILTGNEEPLVNDTQEIEIDLLRHAVKSKGKYSEQQTIIEFADEAKFEISDWLQQRMDELSFLTAAGRSYTLNYDGSARTDTTFPALKFAAQVAAPTAGRIIYAGSATSTATLTAADKMSWNLIVRAKAAAERKRLKPIMDGGKPYYILVISPEQQYDLLADSTYQTIVSRAAERGSKNPLFMNAMAVVQGVVIYSHPKVPTNFGAASKWGVGNNVDGSQALMFGCNGLGFATIGNPETIQGDITDFGNKQSIGIEQMFGLLKPQFNSTYDLSAGAPTRQDYGVMSIYTASAQVVA